MLKSNYSKDAEYKVNIQKSIPYLYTINEQEEFEIKDTMPFTCASTKIKHACINLTKYIQVLHEKNYKTNEWNKNEPKKWSEVSFSWTAGFSIFRMSLLSNLIHTFNAISIKFQASYFGTSNKMILKFIWKSKIARITSTVLKNKTKLED